LEEQDKAKINESVGRVRQNKNQFKTKVKYRQKK
jgi:hypothetical protein